jgi:cytochrome c oxidase subunit 3
MEHSSNSYYVPDQSIWPIVGAIAMFLMLGGTGLTLVDLQTADHASQSSSVIMYSGMAILIFMLFGWFGNVIAESRSGTYSPQVDLSFRYGMTWFIFSEVMFFLAFFGALYYARAFSVPWLGGEGDKGISNMLWPDFEAVWPLLTPPNPELFQPIKEVIDPWHLPLINTILLVTSSFTVTFAHHALRHGERTKITIWLAITLILGLTFLAFQAEEYIEAYQHLDLTLNSGIYGATFFLLTGFHGFHVTVGSIILFILLIRVMKGHFTPDNHFGFEAGSWYWHFVDVVWLLLFLVVYVF